MLIFLAILALAAVFYLFGKKDLSRKFQKIALWWIAISVLLTTSLVIIGALVKETEL